MHAYIHTKIHTCIHACMHAYIHTKIHTYIHTYAHACIHEQPQYALGFLATILLCFGIRFVLSPVIFCFSYSNLWANCSQNRWFFPVFFQISEMKEEKKISVNRLLGMASFLARHARYVCEAVSVWHVICEMQIPYDLIFLMKKKTLKIYLVLLQTCQRELKGWSFALRHWGISMDSATMNSCNTYRPTQLRKILKTRYLKEGAISRIWF